MSERHTRVLAATDATVLLRNQQYGRPSTAPSGDDVEVCPRPGACCQLGAGTAIAVWYRAGGMKEAIYGNEH